MDLDQRMHRAVYKATRNAFLESTLERYFNLSLRLWYLVLDQEVGLRQSVAEHVEVLRGDPRRARATGPTTSMRRHVIGFERAIRKVLGGTLGHAESLFRHRPARLRDVLAEVPQRRQVLRRRRPDLRGRHDRQGDVPIVQERRPLHRDPGRPEPAGGTRTQVADVEGQIRRKGYYPLRMTSDQASRAGRGPGEASQTLPAGDARRRRALDEPGRREAARDRHPHLRLPRQRRRDGGRRRDPAAPSWSSWAKAEWWRSTASR